MLVDNPQDIAAALGALGVRCGRPVLVSVGGASGMAAEHLTAMSVLLRNHAIPVLERLGAAVLDGGTDTGVMGVMGRARADCRATFPLIGVAAVGTIASPGGGAADGRAELEPHHSHVVLVPGDTWGDESPWLSAVAAVVAGGHPSATVVVNGGEITYDDVTHSLAAARPVIVVAGGGRAADVLAAAAVGESDHELAARLGTSPLLQVVSLSDPAAVAAVVEGALSRAR